MSLEISDTQVVWMAITSASIVGILLMWGYAIRKRVSTFYTAMVEYQKSHRALKDSIDRLANTIAFRARQGEGR